MISLMFLFWVTGAQCRCLSTDLFAAEPKLARTHKVCHLRYSTRHAGLARNVKAQCKQNNEFWQSFYYQLSWDPPEYTGTSVVGYRVYIIYSTNEHACFQLPATQHSFVFNRSLGMAYRCHFYFSITPQPISFVNGNSQTPLHLVLGCPIGVKLLPLPNIYVHPQSSFTFTAKFEEEPVPSPNVRWYFSSDRKFCKNRERLKVINQEVVLSQNKHVLKILKANANHVGCYVVSAENGIGGRHEQRGYMDLNNTNADLLPQKQTNIMEMIEGPLFAVIAAILVVMVVVSFALTLKWNRASKNRKKNEEENLLKTKIYISHCMHEEAERNLLFQFSSALNSCGFNVLLDVCSTVEINNLGGLNRWIPAQLMAAKKIVIIATEVYLNELQRNQTCDDSEENFQKVCTEFTMINKVINEGAKSSNDILVLRLGVDINDIIHPMKGFNIVPFPDYFDAEQNSNFKYIINTLFDR